MQQNIENEVAQAWEGAWNEGNYRPLRKLLAPEFVRVSKGSESSVDADGLIKQIDEMRNAFPDMRTTVHKILPSDDEIGFFWSTEGTFTQPLGTVPPTGRQVTTSGATLATVQDSKNASEQATRNIAASLAYLRRRPRATVTDGKLASKQATWNMTALLADLGLPSLASAFDTVDPESPDNADTRERLKDFNKQFVTGVTVITAHDNEEKPRGLAA